MEFFLVRIRTLFMQYSELTVTFSHILTPFIIFQGFPILWAMSITTSSSMIKSPTINFFSPPSLSSQVSSCSRNLSNQRLFQQLLYSSSVTLSVIFLYFTWSLLLWFDLWLISSNFSSILLPWNLMLSCRSAMSFFKMIFSSFKLLIFFSIYWQYYWNYSRE